jgi:hypothetical protein
MISQYSIIYPMNKKQKQTLNKILEKPERSDIPWSNIESLIVALGGEISEGRGSRVRVVLNDVKAVFHRPHPERVTEKGAVKSVRRFLKEAGVIS